MQYTVSKVGTTINSITIWPNSEQVLAKRVLKMAEAAAERFSRNADKQLKKLQKGSSKRKRN